MAQASSAQREPSMEEILASIRRIIEDNDTGRRPAVDFEQMRPEPEDDRLDRNIIEVEAFRAELQAAKPMPVEVKPVEAVQAPTAPEAKAAEPRAVTWPTADPKPAEAVVAEAAALPRTPTASWAPKSTLAVEQMERLAGPAREPDVEAPVSAARGEGAASPIEPAISSVERATADETFAAKPAIISEQAGRQVSAAFGELNDAYAARSRKSFDDIAAEMMRPMLQDWLDNNLPTLVERLVREEIERVARGV
ncbi:hypothetical protein CO731_03767 [Aminobacter sp. MSH1]|uniref:PopZ family protein n=1 Tax=Aminobacter sp. MSH1 TaxID=374606 RepID=UPI000D3868B8|nr:DUF2497 domain-containing protein [Aminobacter sp. MSH1]AWC24285.1 hypothetical protein CO731_03767 [Aminobacter sp. MSH1]